MSDVSALPAEINGLPAALGTVASTVTAAGPFGGVCPSDGAHHPQRSFNCAVRF